MSILEFSPPSIGQLSDDDDLAMIMDDGVDEYMMDIKIKGKLNAFLNSESCRVSGKIKKTVLNYFEEIQAVVARVVEKNPEEEDGQLAERVKVADEVKQRGLNIGGPTRSFAEVLVGTKPVSVKRGQDENRLVIKGNERFKGKDSEEVKKVLLE